jgi:hypothetical protein
MSESNTYIPGVCNINYAEIRKRRNIGLTGLAALLALLGVLFILKAPGIIWGLTFVPAFLMTTGFLQAKNKFCVGYAAAGMRHTGDKAEKVDDREAINKDKQRARSMNLQAVLIALVISILAVFTGSMIG